MKRFYLSVLLLVAATFSGRALAADAPGDARLVLRTNLGDVVIALFPEAARDTSPRSGVWSSWALTTRPTSCGSSRGSSRSWAASGTGWCR